MFRVGVPRGRLLVPPCSCLVLVLSTLAMLPSTTAAMAEANRFVPLAVGETTVGGELGRRIDLTIRNNVLAIDVDRDFLKPFREKDRTGQMGHPQRYIGMGKFLDALVTFSKQTNNAEVARLKDRVLRELRESQLSDGYLGIFKEEYRVFTEWDLHETAYLIQALVADHDRFGNKTSLEMARGLADYVMRRRQCTDPPRTIGKLGAERAFIALGRATGEKKYIDYGVNGMNLRHWDMPVRGHAYTFFNICLAQLDLYGIDANEQLLEQSRKVVDFLRNEDALLVSGSCTYREGFDTNQRLDGHVGETCATAYLIRLLHAMLCIESDSTHGDIMERAVYNALFAAQLPEGRRLRYFTPLEGTRPVYERDTYCCPNNFRRIIAELPSMIYYRADAGVAVNLYAASSAVMPVADNVSLRLSQETDYPNSGKVVLHVDPAAPARFPIRLRIPAWCANARVRVNGRLVDQSIVPGTFAVVDRIWKEGDRVELDMPMTWRLVRGRKTQKGRVAVLRGPLVFCLDPKRLATLNPHVAERLGESSGDSKEHGSRDAILNEIARGLRLDPNSLGEPVNDATVRPNGLACRVMAWSPGASATSPPDLNVFLTEFPDPSGQATYFHVSDPSRTVDDELAPSRR